MKRQMFVFFNVKATSLTAGDSISLDGLIDHIEEVEECKKLKTGCLYVRLKTGKVKTFKLDDIVLKRSPLTRNNPSILTDAEK